MSLQSNLQSVITRIATEFKAIRGILGDPTTLTTSHKSTVVGAINEVSAAAANATGINDASISTSTTWSSSKINSSLPTWSTLSGKPTLSAVATSGSYSDMTGTIPTSALPPLAINEVYTVATQTAMLALTAERGDMAIRSDTGSTFVLANEPASTLANWKEVMAAGKVVSVAGKTGAVTLAKADVGLANVDNTSDASKPISTATQTALDGKADSTHTHTASQVSDASSVGRSVLTAASTTAARSAIGAGTSSLSLGSTGTTAAAGNHTHTHASLTDTTTVGTQIATATTAAAARTVIGAGTGNSDLTLGTTSTTAAAGNHTHTIANISDSTTTGQAVVKAASAAAARSAIGAGTSSLVIGNNAGQAQDSAAVGNTEVDLVAIFESGLAA